MLPPSIGHATGLLQPRTQKSGALRREQLRHRQTTSRERQRQLPVQEFIIETGRRGIVAGRSMDDPADMRPARRRQAHRAGFTAREKRGTRKMKPTQRSTGFTQSHDLRMRRGIAVARHTIATAADDPAIKHDQGAEGAATIAGRGAGEGQGFAEKFLVGRHVGARWGQRDKPRVSWKRQSRHRCPIFAFG